MDMLLVEWGIAKGGLYVIQARVGFDPADEG